MTLHWVMYEKSMGMCAADMCEGVLAHARRLFSSNVHVLSAPSPHHRAAAGSGKGCEGSDTSVVNLMVVGDSRLSCAAREARALHGMLVTIHEVSFPHHSSCRICTGLDLFVIILDVLRRLQRAHVRACRSNRRESRDSTGTCARIAGISRACSPCCVGGCP